MEEILKAGGFLLKPWVLSHQSGRSVAPIDSGAKTTAPRTLVLPIQMKDEENKALGVGYEPETAPGANLGQLLEETRENEDGT